jgi:hypothetical protein
MAQPHPRTAEERAHYVQQLFVPEGEYGFVTQLRHQIGASRQTVYAWRARGAQALVAACQPATPGASRADPCLARQVLTRYVAGHASYRGMQRTLREVTGQGGSLGHIHTVLAQAPQRARQWLATHQPPDRRAVALDEIDGHRRDGA